MVIHAASPLKYHLGGNNLIGLLRVIPFNAITYGDKDDSLTLLYVVCEACFFIGA